MSNPCRNRCAHQVLVPLMLGLVAAYGSSQDVKSQKPAQQTAQAQADAAQVIKDANAATKNANLATQKSNTAADSAVQATSQSNTAASDAAAAAAQAKASATDAAKATEMANQAAASAASLVKQATDAITEEETAKSQAKKAIAEAQSHNTPQTAVKGIDNVGPKDYVPCLFDRATLLAMRGYGKAKNVTPEKVAEAGDAASAKLPNPAAQAQFLANFTAGIGEKQKLGLIITPEDVVGAAANSLSKLKMDDPEVAHAVPEALDAATMIANTAGDETEQQFQRSKYIACSMSIFPWDLSHMIFGRTVANHYLAVQIIVRNLDQDHEYLIHDSELAVDAYSGQLERFQASHEKEAVRGVVVYGQNYDLHAVWSHTVEGIGMIGGAIVGLPQPSIDQLTQASGAYNAAWIPTFQKLFPDLTTNNLNNLNDLGFSAASSSRIVVPKAGAVPFVIFVPVKPLEEACWLQHGYKPDKDVLPHNACESIKPVTNPADKDGKWRQVIYKDWTPMELAALQKHAYAVVAGSLIQQVNDTVSLRAITCGSPDSDGKLYLAGVVGTGATANKTLNCSLTGAALDSMTKLRLEDATGADIADAPVTPGADSTTAQAVFAAADVPKLLLSTYELYSVDKSGTATDLKQRLSVVPPPVVSAATTQGNTLSSGTLSAGFTLTLTGTNLDQVTQVQLALTPANSTKLVATSQSCSSTQCTATFAPTTLAAGQNYEAYVGVGPSKASYDVGKSLGPLVQ